MIFIIIAFVLLIVGFGILFIQKDNIYRKTLEKKRLIEDKEQRELLKKERDKIELELQKGRERIDQQKRQDEKNYEEYKRLLLGQQELEAQKQKEQLKNSLKDLEFEQQRQFEQFINDLEKKKQELAAAANNEIQSIKLELEEWQGSLFAKHEKERLEEQAEKEWESHHIIFTEKQRNAISKLLQICEEFQEPEIQDTLKKLIWKSFIEKPYNEMIKRQFGANVPSNVIYSIQDNNKKEYIGKTAQSIKDRWKEHIMNSLGIGKNKEPQKIHLALFNNWENFSFSIMEQCNAKNLAEKEKYWIETLGVKEYGYNMKG